MDSNKTLQERDQTDRSLYTERENTDQALVDKLALVDADADDVVDRARTKADAVLDKARDAADQQPTPAAPAASGVAEIAEQRAQEDSAINAERSAADARLSRGRQYRAEALAALLPLKRENTDQHLLRERHRSDDELALRDDFMGRVAHDLRDLLNSIVLSTTALANQASASEEGQRTVKGGARIQRYAARMNRLIGDLVDVVSIDAGRLAVHPLPGDAKALLAELVETFTDVASQKRLSLTLDCGTAPLQAAFDHDRLLQVLGNLLSNAIKFTPSGGVINVSGALDGADLHLTVRDSGIGIPAEKLDAIFERFWQVESHNERGLGLGLYISKCIVDNHGGRLWAESEPGAGSRFHLTIPRQAKRAD